MIDDGDYERLKAAIHRHKREDGTVNYTDLGAEIGLHRSNAKRRVKMLYASGALGFEPVMPGFEATKVRSVYDGNGELKSESITQSLVVEEKPFEVGAGRSVGKVTSHVKDGLVVQEWVRTSADKLHPLDVADMLVKHFENIKTTHVPLPGPRSYDRDRLTLIPVADLHMGVKAWKGDAGQNWDLDIAERVFNKAADDLFASTGFADVGVILGGGDQTHADNNFNMTSKSHNILQVDGRYDKIIGKTEEFFVGLTERSLRKFKRVIVRILKGNHDEHAAVAIAHFLKAWFRNNSRVEVDVSADLFWPYQYGKVMLASTHGHESKPTQMPLIMAARWPTMWGNTVHRFAHTFHVHNASKFLSTEGGVIVETHETPVPQDAYHWGKGYLSGRSLQSIVYDSELGEVGRSRVALTSERAA